MNDYEAGDCDENGGFYDDGPADGPFACFEDAEDCDRDEDFDDDFFDPDDEDEDAFGDDAFADPGGNSALRAASRSNPRNQPCPTCGARNALTPADVRHRYQCNRCADRDEGVGY